MVLYIHQQFLGLLLRNINNANSQNITTQLKNFLTLTVIIYKTRMHSSRMRTGRLFTVCWSILPWGVVGSGGVWSGGGSGLRAGGSGAGGGVWCRGGLVSGRSGPGGGGLVPGGGISQHALRQTPSVDRQTPVKILPWPNFVAAGNYKTRMHSSRVRTGRLLTLSCSIPCISGGLLYADPRGRPPPYGQREWHTLVKTLHSLN